MAGACWTGPGIAVAAAVGEPVAAAVGVAVAGGAENGLTVPPYASTLLPLLPRLKNTNWGFGRLTWREMVLPLRTWLPPCCDGPRLVGSGPVLMFRSALSAVAAIEMLTVASAPGLPS